MNYNDVVTLAKAGFNAQQIRALMQLGQTQGQTQGQQLQGGYVRTNTNADNQNNSSVYGAFNAMDIYPDVIRNNALTEISPFQQQLDNMSQQINGITQALRLGNIANAQQPPEETVDSILASIINPPDVLGGEANVN